MVTTRKILLQSLSPQNRQVMFLAHTTEIVIILLITFALVNSEFTCSFISVNVINSTLNVATIDSLKGGIIQEKDYQLSKHINYIATQPSTSESLFFWQLSSSSISMLRGNSTLVQNFITLSPTGLVDLQQAGSVTINNNVMYVLQSTEMRQQNKYYIINGPTAVMGVNMTNGNATRLFNSADEGDTGILIGAFTSDDTNLYYTLGPYGSYALVTQDKKTGEVISIRVVRDQQTGDSLIPMHLFVYNGDLWAVLVNEKGRDVQTVLARVDSQSGQYREELPLYKVFGAGKVMQRMSTIYNKYLLGWFANGEGSTSKLFAIDLVESNIVTAVNYYEQKGRWKALGYTCN